MKENTEVPVPPPDDSRPGNGLPNPDLNPMMNPTLGKNLGLWAQVYFTSPPERREEAVQQLLRDLEKGIKPDQIQASASQTQDEIKPAQKAAEFPGTSSTPDGIVCPACLHRNDVKQRFCGLCGFTLRTKEPAEAPPVSTPVPRQTEAVERNPDDWQWLHQKNLVDLQSSTQGTVPWRLFLVAAVLILAIAGYLFWSRNTTATSQAILSSASQANPAPPIAPKTEPTHSQQQSSPRAAESDENAKAGAINIPTKDVTEQQAPVAADNPENEVPTEAVSSPESGVKELEMAHRYLDGIAVPRNGEAAAFWLWKAVKKNNDEAVLLLSDLYIKGEGVPQSCDQARVLLGAAAKRGSSAAGSKLKAINSSNCR